MSCGDEKCANCNQVGGDGYTMSMTENIGGQPVVEGYNECCDDAAQVGGGPNPFNFIINPVTGARMSLFSSGGKAILQNLIRQYKYGGKEDRQKNLPTILKKAIDTTEDAIQKAEQLLDGLPVKKNDGSDATGADATGADATGADATGADATGADGDAGTVTDGDAVAVTAVPAVSNGDDVTLTAQIQEYVGKKENAWFKEKYTIDGEFNTDRAVTDINGILASRVAEDFDGAIQIIKDNPVASGGGIVGSLITLALQNVQSAITQLSGLQLGGNIFRRSNNKGTQNIPEASINDVKEAKNNVVTKMNDVVKDNKFNPDTPLIKLTELKVALDKLKTKLTGLKNKINNSQKNVGDSPNTVAVTAEGDVSSMTGGAPAEMTDAFGKDYFNTEADALKAEW